MTETVKFNQVLPQGFADLLAQLRKDADPRLSMVLAVASLNGWTQQSLADALGVSRQAVDQRISRATLRAGASLPEVPLPPRKPLPAPKVPRRRLLVHDELAERLRRMAATAATVNGGTPADAPERRVSEDLSALLQSLVEQGVTVYHLAQVLETTPSGVAARLARHGYRDASPSQSGQRYIGRASHEGPDRELRSECNRGHELTGTNLYVIPKTGARVCRKCDAARRNAYLQRKQQAAARGGVR